MGSPVSRKACGAIVGDLVDELTSVHLNSSTIPKSPYSNTVYSRKCVLSLVIDE